MNVQACTQYKPPITDEQISRAIENFARFYSRNKDSVSFDEVQGSSAGVHGWALSEVWENSSLTASRVVTLQVKRIVEEDLVEIVCLSVAGREIANFVLPLSSEIRRIQRLLADQFNVPTWVLCMLLSDGTLLTKPYLDCELASLL